MSQNFHTPYEDGVTQFKASDMNSPLSELDAALSQIGITTYDIGGTFETKPGASQVLLRFPFPRDVDIPVGLADSQMVAGVAATAQTIFSIKKNGTEFGTATFAAAGTVATMASATGASFAAGDVITMVAPASPDNTLANLGWCIAGRRTVLTSTTTTTTTTTSTSTSTSSSTTTTTTTTTA